MAGKSRILNAVRKNADFARVKRFCEDNDLDYEVLPPRSKGHPKVRITDGTHELYYPISCSPSGHTRVANVTSQLRKKWSEIVGNTDGQND